MRRGAKYALGFMVLLGLMFVLLVVASFRLVTKGTRVSVADGSYVNLKLSGSYHDRAPVDSFPIPDMDDTPDTLISVQSALKLAKKDERIRGVLLEVSNLQVGWGVAQEFRDSLEDFQSSGKPVIAFLEMGRVKDYYVASVADKLFLAPEGMLFLNGLSVDAEFFKEALEKLGVEADYHHIGEYKSAAETYTRSSMSKAHREALESIVDSIYGQMLEGIANGRQMSTEAVEDFINDFSISGARLVEAKIVDALLYRDQVVETLKDADGDEPELIAYDKFRNAASDELDVAAGEKIGLLYVSGEIRSGENSRGFLGGEVVGSETIVEAAKQLREDDDIKAVVMRIDSPGGSALAADVMWHELVRLQEEKPLIVSMSDLAASGGYWIATAGGFIVAQPGTITGSIGVFMGKLNLNGRMGPGGEKSKPGLTDKVGISIATVSRGRYAEMFSPFRMFDDGEIKKIDAMLHETYDSFLDRVSKARNMSVTEVDKVARGRIWTGEQALERSLVDELGGLDTALALAKEKGGLDPEKPYPLAMYPQEESFFRRLLSQLGVRGEIRLRSELEPLFSLLTAESDTLEPGPQVLMPYTLHVR